MRLRSGRKRDQLPNRVEHGRKLLIVSLFQVVQAPSDNSIGGEEAANFDEHAHDGPGAVALGHGVKREGAPGIYHHASEGLEPRRRDADQTGAVARPPDNAY